MQSFISIALSIFFVVNVVGNIPLFITLLRPFNKKEQKMILLREFGVALAILLLFNFCGDGILHLLGVSKQTIGIAGGFLLIIIAITMVFPKPSEDGLPAHEPVIVPLATPVIAGPGSITAVMVFAQQIGTIGACIAATSAIFVSFFIVLIASRIKHLLGEKGLIAMERLGGLIVALLAIEMMTSGIIDLVKARFF